MAKESYMGYSYDVPDEHDPVPDGDAPTMDELKAQALENTKLNLDAMFPDDPNHPIWEPAHDNSVPHKPMSDQEVLQNYNNIVDQHASELARELLGDLDNAEYPFSPVLIELQAILFREFAKFLQEGDSLEIAAKRVDKIVDSLTVLCNDTITRSYEVMECANSSSA